MKTSFNTYVVDIDGTICSHEKNSALAVPYKRKIEKVNKLYDEGHTIIYQTARGTITGKDWREVTEKQFKKWGVKYHHLLFGKAFGTFYIDDKAINARDFFK